MLLPIWASVFLFRLREGVQEKDPAATVLPVTCWLLSVTLVSSVKDFLMELLLCFKFCQGVLAADAMTWLSVVTTAFGNLVKEWMDSS